MNWSRFYRVALRTLPAPLREKHGEAMATLFERELTRAREQGRLAMLFTAVSGLSDVLLRSSYERTRPAVLAMTSPVASAVVRRHSASFVIAFLALTACFLSLFARRAIPGLSARGESLGAMLELLMLALPYIAAMTIPMAVFIAVLWAFPRLAASAATETQRTPLAHRQALRTRLLPLLGAASIVSVAMLVVTAEVVPRANARLASAMAGQVVQRGDRSMTLGELRDAAAQLRAEEARAMPAVDLRRRGRLANFDVEIQKKYALSAACFVLALAGAACSACFSTRRLTTIVLLSALVFGVYYACLLTGESLADQLVIPPWLAMWGANGVLLVAAILALRRPLTTGVRGPELLAV